MSKARIHQMGFAVVVLAALHLGEPRLLSADAVDPCPVLGYSNTVCEYDICITSPAYQIERCLEENNLLGNENCCVEVDDEICYTLTCGEPPNLADDLNCYFWTGIPPISWTLS